MLNFYQPRKEAGRRVPHILGLTASPIIGSKLSALETLEALLDSKCKSPRYQKEELLLHVKRPNLTQLRFESDESIMDVSSGTCTMKSLSTVYANLNIYDDPEIVRLRTQNTEASRNRMELALKKRKTYIQDQMKSFIQRADGIFQALGCWAADSYISQVISTCIKSADSKDIGSWQWSDIGKRYLADALRTVDVSPGNLSILSELSISQKVCALVDFLYSCDEKTTGIIFVKERAFAYMLHRLLSSYPATCHRLRFETVVGMSQRPCGKQDMYELPKSEDSLAKFRSGEINILIATSVLEEGIDVPKCKLVICFDEPATLKSYIQCRGRARLPESRYVMLLDTTSEDHTTQWEELEHEMKLKYEEDERNIQRLAGIEASEKKQYPSRQFRVNDALLDMDSAKGHLEYFCSRLSSHSSVVMRPEYIILEQEDDKEGHDNQPLFSAKVILPAALDSTLRVRKSRFSWHSEKNATKDAAFEAYVALYHAGLVNDNLLPLSFVESSNLMEEEDSILEVIEQLNPWPRVARAWEAKEKLHSRDVTLKDQYGIIKCKVSMLIPIDFLAMGPFSVYWDAETEWRIEIGLPRTVLFSESTTDHTTTFLSLAYRHRWEVENLRHVVVFKAIDTDISQIKPASVEFSHQICIEDSVGLLRDPENHGYPYLFKSWLSTKPSIQSLQYPHKDFESFHDNQPFVALKKWSRRSDFLHPVAQVSLGNGREYSTVLPQALLQMDLVPIQYSQFGLLIPSILHKIEVQLIVEELCATLFMDVEISNRQLIRTAISSPVAREQDNYQKLEFLGDSTLKFLVFVFVASRCK
jgi:ERCC4-related helicase